MPKKQYAVKRLSEKRLKIIAIANQIIDEYRGLGLNLTLRQLYYQFVARDLIPNDNASYKRLGKTISDGRRLGLVDWSAIEDRTRNLKGRTTWDSIAQIMDATIDSYHKDMWAEQDTRVELWVEKEALAGVFDRVCHEYSVPIMACRGYMSDSEMWNAAQRILARASNYGNITLILHFGDHDPSGIDMTRDIEDRLHLFGAGQYLDVRRIALNEDQIQEYNPPPNPAKVTDSRAKEYIKKYGDQSWELDALDPTTLQNLAEDHIANVIDTGQWEIDEEIINGEKDTIREFVDSLEQ